MKPEKSNRIASKVADRYLYGFDPSGEWEKMIAEQLIQNTGVDNADKAFFDTAKKNVADEMEITVKELEDMDPSDLEDDKYDDLVRGVMEAADEEGLIGD